MTNKSAAQCVNDSGLKLSMRLKAGSLAVMPYLTMSTAPFWPSATWASMKPRAMRMPPAATNGIM